MRSGRGKVETMALIWAAFSVSSSISGKQLEESDVKCVEMSIRKDSYEFISYTKQNLKICDLNKCFSQKNLIWVTLSLESEAENSKTQFL